MTQREKNYTRTRRARKAERAYYSRMASDLAREIDQDIIRRVIADHQEALERTPFTRVKNQND